MGLIDFTEPFTTLINQGMVLLDGSKMSKSKGNLVEFSSSMIDPGADVVRVALAFAGPVEDDINWEDVSTAGAQKFWPACCGSLAMSQARSTSFSTAGTPHCAARRTSCSPRPRLSWNRRSSTSWSPVSWELVNITRKTIDGAAGAADPAVREAAETIAVMLDLFAPHTAEEVWEILGHEPSVGLVPWRSADPALLVEDTITAVVQVGGKVRAQLEVSARIGESELEALARADERVIRSIGDREIVKVRRARAQDRQHRREG